MLGSISRLFFGIEVLNTILFLFRLKKLQEPSILVIPEDKAYRLDQWEAKSLNELMAYPDKRFPSFDDAPQNSVIDADKIKVITQKNGQGWNAALECPERELDSA